MQISKWSCHILSLVQNSQLAITTLIVAFKQV